MHGSAYCMQCNHNVFLSYIEVCAFVGDTYLVKSLESFRVNDIQNLKISYLFLTASNLLRLSFVSEAKN